MSVVILNKKRAQLSAPTTSTAIKAPVGGEPSLETTVIEAMAIQKFLRFGLEDIHFQLEQVSKDRAVSRQSFANAKHSAATIASWITGCLQDVEVRLATALSAGNDKPN